MISVEQRGLLIATTMRINQKADKWMVPSQTGSGFKYAVTFTDDGAHCTCPDHEISGKPCKHIFAVEFFRKGEEATEEDALLLCEEQKKGRKTYPQKWKAYNSAQTSEKENFQRLLSNLCQTIPDPPAAKTGRPRLKMADAVFACCFKIFSTFSGRRFMTDLRDSQSKGYITHAPHYNSIFNYLEDPEMTPLLQRLITTTSLPLKAVEVDFAVDSSGFSTSRFVRWYDQKWGTVREKHHWVKVQLMCGVKTNIVTAVDLPEIADSGDSPYLPAMVRHTAENFQIREVSADKGYSSVANHDVIAEVGGAPFIPFKSVATGASGGLWQKMFHFFSFNREEFLEHYHRRSNVETTFSMIKAKFRDHLRSKTDVAMRNEILCKIICHNICCVNQEMHELGISAEFSNAT